MQLSVRDINGTKDSWTIKVKTILLWKQSFRNNPRQISSMDMILMDQEGNKIQATVKRNLLVDFESLFDEGCVREITNFGVASNTGDYMLVKHDCKINFYRTTKVRVLNDFEPAESVQEYNFPTFIDLLQKNIDMRVAFDVVCQVVDTEPMTLTYEHGREKRIMSVQIRDLSGKQISCALWGEFALKLHTYIVENQNSTAPVIMLLRNAKLKEWAGKPQVSNCLFGTKLYINDDIQPISVFKESLLGYVGDSSSTILTPLSWNTVIAKEEDYYLKFLIRNIEDIRDFKTDTGLTIIATVISLQNDEGWYYFACRTCSKKVVRNDGADGSEPFDCTECGSVSDVYSKLRVVVRVQDATGSSSFVLFERHITSLVNRSASFLHEKINKDEGRQLFPDEFKTLLNRKFVFKIQVSEFNIMNNYLAYTVHKLTDDENVMDVILKRSPTYEERKIDDDGTPNNLANKQKEIVSVMDDNTNIVDLEASTPLNARKRSIEIVDGTASFDCSSSKALKDVDTLKIPKMEKLE